MKTTKPLVMILKPNATFARQADAVPQAIAESLKDYPVATDEPGDEYFIPSYFLVSFAACDGNFTKRVSSLAGAAAKIRDHIGAADADFGFVSDDGVCRCTSVVARIKGSTMIREVSRQWLITTFPAKATV